MNQAAESFSNALNYGDSSLSILSNEAKKCETLLSFLEENGIKFKRVDSGNSAHFIIDATEDQKGALEAFVDDLFDFDDDDDDDEEEESGATG